MTTVQPVILMFRRGDRFEPYLKSCLRHIAKQEIPKGVVLNEPRLSTPTTKPFTHENRDIVFNTVYMESMNELLDYGAEHADYTWLFDADIEAPPHALRTLLSYNVDIAIGVSAFHNHRDIMICGRQPKNVTHGLIPRGYEYLRKRLWTHEDNFVAGLYCVLIKKHVKTRVQCGEDHAGDTNWWYNTRNAGYTHIFDPNLVCGHLPQWPLESYMEDPL